MTCPGLEIHTEKLETAFFHRWCRISELTSTEPSLNLFVSSIFVPLLYWESVCECVQSVLICVQVGDCVSRCHQPGMDCSLRWVHAFCAPWDGTHLSDGGGRLGVGWSLGRLVGSVRDKKKKCRFWLGTYKNPKKKKVVPVPKEKTQLKIKYFMPLVLWRGSCRSYFIYNKKQAQSCLSARLFDSIMHCFLLQICPTSLSHSCPSFWPTPTPLTRSTGTLPPSTSTNPRSTRRKCKVGNPRVINLYTGYFFVNCDGRI